MRPRAGRGPPGPRRSPAGRPRSGAACERRRVRAERVDHRPPGMQTDRRVAFLQRGSELGSALEELESHSGPLGPLAREHEGHPRGAVRRGGRFAGLEAHGELPGQVRRRGPHDREAMEVMGAAHRRGVADVRDGRDLVRFEPPSKRLRAGDQRILSMSGERRGTPRPASHRTRGARRARAPPRARRARWCRRSRRS